MTVLGRWWVLAVVAAGCGAGQPPAPATSAAGPTPDRGEPGGPAPASALSRARPLLEAAKISEAWQVNARSAATARDAGLTEDVAIAAVEELAADCLARDAECPELSPLGRRGGDRGVVEELETLVGLLGELGGERSVPLLLRLDARGFYRAGAAREALMTRVMMKAVEAYACPPPTADEVAAARAQLAGFVALDTKGRETLVARPATARELDDLAYFLASSEGSGAEVGRPVEEGETSWTAPGPRSVPREQLLARISAGQRAGDAKATAAAARAFLETLGYPGAIRLPEADEHAWGGPRLNYVMRDLAEALEAAGELDEAAHLYRRANPGGGACGTSVSSVWQSQVRGVVRCEERRRRCRAVVPERLLGLGGYPYGSDVYGTKRLVDSGFDVARLFRGALVTINRDAEPASVEEALGRAPAKLRAAAIARLRERGPEDWERRVFALEGYADAAGREAVPVLLAAAAAATRDVRLRAIGALGRLAAMPYYDPCDPDGRGHGSGSSEWEREIDPLGDACETMVRPDEAEALVSKLLPLARDPDWRIREAIARALGEINAPGSTPALEELRQDTFQDTEVSVCQQGADGAEQQCRNPHPVREAAEEGLAHIAELRANREGGE